MTFFRACAVILPLSAFACDLEPKDIGNESETNGNGGSDSGGTDDGSPACVDGDVMDGPDGCGSCTCENGEWACPAIGCADDGPAPICEDGDVMDAPDGCNTCTCSDGAWACTEIACNNDEGPVCEDGDVMDAPDGCNTCTCEGGAWACTEAACPMGWFGDEILVCDPGAPQDALSIDAVVLEGDSLAVEVSYSGGCAEHDFGMCWDAAFLESSPVQVNTFISHESNDDDCDSVPSEQLTFDLVPLRDAWHASYGAGPGEITIHIDGWAEAVAYTFE